MIILALQRPDSRTRELSFTPKHTNPKPETSASHRRQKPISSRKPIGGRLSVLEYDHLTQHSHCRSANPRSCLFRFVLPLFFLYFDPDCASSDRASSSVLRSSRSWFVLLQNRALETRFCFLELESIRLEIYVTFSWPSHQV